MDFIVATDNVKESERLEKCLNLTRELGKRMEYETRT